MKRGKIWVIRRTEKEITDFHIPEAIDGEDAMRRYRLGEGAIAGRETVEHDFEMWPLK